MADHTPSETEVGNSPLSNADRLARMQRRAWWSGKNRRARTVQAQAEAMERRHKAMGID